MKLIHTFIVTIYLTGSLSFGATYYCATTGNNSHDGSSNTPWATPGYASKQLTAGDTLMIRGGTYVLTNYYDDIVWTTNTGLPGAWITILGDPTNRPVLKGCSNLSHAVNIADKAFLHIENLEICSLPDAPYSGGLRSGIDGLGSYGHSNIILRDIEIHHIEETGIAFDADSANILIDNLHIHHSGYTAISGDYADPGSRGWQNITITNCLLEHMGLYKNGEEVQSDWDRPDGVGFETSEGPVVIANTVVQYGFGDGLDSKSEKTHIHHCTVANNYGDGIKLWGGDSVVDNCLVYGTGYTLPGTTTPWCLLIIDTIHTDACFRVSNCTFYDDPSRANAHYTSTIQYDNSTVPIRVDFKNNIFSGLSRCWLSSHVNLTVENNIFNTQSESVQLEWGGTNYTTATISSLGSGNTSTDPLFIQAEWGTNAHFQLQATSPAIDTGTNAIDQGTNQVFQTAPLFDDFDGDSLDLSTWLICEKAWGPDNRGVVHENVFVSNGILYLEGHGSNYTGSVMGVDKWGVRTANVTKVGAAIATSNYFASGTFEARMKLPPALGNCAAMWTFHYEEAYPGSALWIDLTNQGYHVYGDAGSGYYTIRNQEIDIETPTGLPGDWQNYSYQHMRLNTWIGEYWSEYTPTYLDTGYPWNDGAFHTFRFDWHTGSTTETQRVEFYIDGQCYQTNYTHVPNIAGRLWLGLWFPTWTGNPEFDTQYLEVDWVRIEPYQETGDLFINETYPDDGWWHDTNITVNVLDLIDIPTPTGW